MRWLAVLVALLALSSTQANIFSNIIGQIKGMFSTYEEVSYSIIRSAPGYEERSYPAKKWVCTRGESNSGEVMEILFWRLFRYLSKYNSETVKIPLAVPVTTEYTVRGPTDKIFVMCFFLGEEYQSNPPAPVDPNVVIQNRPELRVLTRTVGGYFETAEQWMEESGRLAAVIEENGETVSLNHQYWVGYDPPLKFWNRRNEVWFPRQE